MHVILSYNIQYAINCQQQWQKRGNTNVIYGWDVTISIEIQKELLFRKKFPAIKYCLGSSISQPPPLPLSCLQCYLHDGNWRLKTKAEFPHPTSSGWDFRCWCSVLGEISGVGVLLWASQGLSSSPSFCCRMRNEHRSVGNTPVLNWILPGSSEMKNYSTSCNETSVKWDLWSMFWWMWTCINLW